MLLELRHARKRYGRSVVIPDLSLSIAEGDLVGVIGPNGAGKTTAFGLMAGHLSCDGGAIWFDGRDVTRLSAQARCRAGIGRTFQIPQPFVGMTVYENTLVAALYGAGASARQAEQEACAALERCGLRAIGDTPAGALTLLQRKRLEMARALATRPRLLLLDEVGGGLTDAEARQLIALVQEVHAQGVTVVWIEHLVHALVSVAKRLVVLTEGRVIADGIPSEVIRREDVRETYLGSDLDELLEADDVAG